MNSLRKKLALGLVAASAVTFLVTVGQAQQDTDAIRAKCINEVMRMYPNLNPDQTNRQGLEYYKTCMLRHGLQP
jgi:hypothetical protein